MKTLFLTLLATMSVEKLLAKTKIPRQAQFLNFTQSLLELFAMRIILLQILLDSSLEVDLLAKTMSQEHSPVMSQVAPSEENFDFAVSFWHNTQTSLLVHFLCRESDSAYYIPFPSKNTNLKSQNNRISRIFED